MVQPRYAREASLLVVVLASWFSATLDRHQVIQHPFPSLIVSLAIAGLLIWISCSFYERFGGKPAEEYAAIPLQETDHFSNESVEDDKPQLNLLSDVLDTTSRRRFLLLLVPCLVLRLLIIGRVSQKFQCSSRGFESFIPLILAIYDLVAARGAPQVEEEDDFANSIFEDIAAYFARLNPRFLIPATMLSAGIYITRNRPASGNFICLASDQIGHELPVLQIAGILLDSVVTTVLWWLLRSFKDQRKRLRLISLVLLSTAIIAGVVGMPLSFLASAPSIPFSFNGDFLYESIRDGVVFALLTAGLCHTVTSISSLTAVMIIAFACISTTQVGLIFSRLTPFPPTSHVASLMATILSFTGFIIYMRLAQSGPSTASFPRRIPGFFQLLSFVLLIIATFVYLLKPSTIGYHPINLMMYQGRITHDRWLKQASSSGSLAIAVSEYRGRYGREPPPRFDKWYEFAKDQKSTIIDDFDQIVNDLKPYWGVEPAQLRALTSQFVEGSHGDILGIRIQNSRVYSMKAPSEDNIWIVEEFAKMVEPFIHWLPDIEFAINLNGEPKVAAPWDQVHQLIEQGKSVKSVISKDNNDFTSSQLKDLERSDGHPASRRNELEQEPSLSWDAHYNALLSACPPSSKFRQKPVRNIRDFCSQCAYSHMLGQFVRNWTLALDICNQPDIANLHEYFMAPATTDYQSAILPVFSRSKLSGFSDILIPWPGGHTNKGFLPQIPHDPFEQLNNALFWTGNTSAGFTNSNSWEGIHQQRLAHLVHNYTTKSYIPVLVPADSERFAYRDISAKDLASSLKFNVRINDIEGCNKLDCGPQIQELGLDKAVSASGSSNPYDYRYVLALDHKGPPADFLPFLRSRSLPFKSSIFKEWYDSRLTPWLHFVPQDIRFQGLHGTLAYFMGLKVKVGKAEIEMPDKSSEAYFIAEQGRRWAEQALRKEDMSIYLFRLLLEWARLVDDRRSEIGFTM